MNSTHTYYGPVRVLFENLLAHADLLTAAEFDRALARFRKRAWALLRHEWAFHGRNAALKRIDEFERLLPERTVLFWRAASLCPPAVGRLSRRALHVLRGQSDKRGAT